MTLSKKCVICLPEVLVRGPTVSSLLPPCFSAEWTMQLSSFPSFEGLLALAPIVTSLSSFTLSLSSPSSLPPSSSSPSFSCTLSYGPSNSLSYAIEFSNSIKRCFLNCSRAAFTPWNSAFKSIVDSSPKRDWEMCSSDSSPVSATAVCVLPVVAVAAPASGGGCKFASLNATGSEGLAVWGLEAGG